MIENMIHRSTVHEVLIAVFQVRAFSDPDAPELAVLEYNISERMPYPKP